MNIGEKLKAIRLDKGYSITEVVSEASLGGRSRKADIARLERIEDGRDEPTLEQLIELKSVLEFDIEQMVDTKKSLADQIISWEVFNNNCRKLYLENDYTLRELEEKMDIEYYNTVSRLFSNSEVKTNISDDDIQKIMDFFEVDMDYLNTVRDTNYFEKSVNRPKKIREDKDVKLEKEIKKLKAKLNKQEKEIAELQEKINGNKKKGLLNKLFCNL